MNQSQIASTPCSPLQSKAKVMAARYERYCRLKQQAKPNPHLQKLYKCLSTVQQAVGRAWKLLVPKCIRGPATPYQALQMNLPSSGDCLEGVSFSKISVTQGLLNNRICLLVTYAPASVQQTIARMHSNQQINGLLNKKAVIFPVPVTQDGVACYRDSNKLCQKIDQLLEINCVGRKEQQVLVLWKGLYEQVLVIGHFQLTDLNLCYDVLRVIQEREDYEAMIRRLAGQKQGQFCDQSSTNYISEQSTGVSGDSSEL